MSQEQEHRPVTYGDVFPRARAAGGMLADQPVTTEDAALMQSAESLAFGHTQKGGVASAMQAAAEKNVREGLVEREAHSMVAEYGVGVTETAVPGAVLDVSYLAGQAVAGSTHPTPTDPAVAAMEAVTIGEALEAAAVGAADKEVDASDASAILSAEARATGVSQPTKGGVASVAQSAAEFNQRAYEGKRATLGDVLMDATLTMSTDKVVTHEDAEKVIQAELRHKPSAEGIYRGGVGAAMAAAADLNERAGLIPPAVEHKHRESLPEHLRHLEESGRTRPVAIESGTGDEGREEVAPRPTSEEQPEHDPETTAIAQQERKPESAPPAT